MEPPDPDTDPTGHLDIFPRLFLREVARRMADDLMRVVDELRPDVIVRESVEFAVPRWRNALDCRSAPST